MAFLTTLCSHTGHAAGQPGPMPRMPLGQASPVGPFSAQLIAAIDPNRTTSLLSPVDTKPAALKILRLLHVYP